MIRSRYAIFALLLLALGCTAFPRASLHAAENPQIFPIKIADVLRDGQTGMQLAVQGTVEVVQEDNAAFRISDESFSIDVAFHPQLPRVSLRKGDKVLIIGVVREVFLKPNFLVAMDVKLLRSFLPYASDNPLKAEPEAAATKDYTANPNAVLPIDEVKSEVPEGMFVNIQGTVTRFVKDDIFLLEDSTGSIPIRNDQKLHQILNVEPNDPIKIRGAVTESEGGGRFLKAIYIEHLSRKKSHLIQPPPEGMKAAQGEAKRAAAAARDEAPATTANAPQPAAEAPAEADSVEARLAKLKQLYDRGLITEEKYHDKMDEILSEL